MEVKPPNVSARSTAEDSAFARVLRVIIFSLGRLMALLILTALMLYVLLLVGYLVLPSNVFSEIFSSAPGLPFIKPNLRETLAAACATFFVITLFLWVFDAIEFFPFRHPWMSKTVWLTGIASIMSTSVLVYSQVIGPQPQELDGIWQARATYPSHQTTDKDGKTRVYGGSQKDHIVVMTYDPDSSLYIGQSDVSFDNWFSLKLNLRDGSAVLTMNQEIISEGNQPDTSTSPVRWNRDLTTVRDKFTLENNKTRIVIDNGTFLAGRVALQRHGPFE